MPDEPQPQDAELGQNVQEDPAETLIGEIGTDPLDAGYVPPDRPYALDRFGMTSEEEREGESLGQRLSDEEPDVQDDDGWSGYDSSRAGRLVAADEGAHEDREATLTGQDVGVDGGAASAEEAAMHVVEESDAEVSSVDGPPAEEYR